MNVSSESVPRKGLLSEKASSLPSAQRSYIPDRGLLLKLKSLEVLWRVFGVRELELVTMGRGRKPGVRRLPRLQRL
jgi:hypothetical protein